ncbi:TetR/AcrR family transcriptional regulator [Vagococcus fluvialis]|uniref:TetR/AcrR family transcriptional regulator n=2 Tax=Vagococcus fluvialis TaxID=2738 RepID=UPI001D0AB75E|nr:TetR/AcrR family transcriptional regulator [Vagococcus fluvialis]
MFVHKKENKFLTFLFLVLYSSSTTKHKVLNKEHVVEVAARLFFEKGFIYTSMDEIVKVSNVSKSNVYYHFANKDELLDAAIDYWFNSYQKDLELIFSQTKFSVEQKILLFLENLSTGIKK